MIFCPSKLSEPQKIAKTGIKYETYDKNVGPAFEIKWKRIKNAIAVGKQPKYINEINDLLENKEGL